MNIFDLNIALFRLINNSGKEWPFLNPVFLFLAEDTIFFLCLGVAAYWFLRRNQNRIMIISAGIAFLIAEIIGKVLGRLYSNHQPFAELSNVNQLIDKAVDNSFPSDHTILFFSFCFTLLLFRKKASWLWLFLAFLVGLSRIGAGVHYPMDVLAGAVIAVFSASIAYVFAPRNRFIQHLLMIYEKGESFLFSAKTKSRNL